VASKSQYDRAASELRRLRHDTDATSCALDVTELVRCATLAASSHNTQPWRFRAGERSLEIFPDFARRCPIVDPDDSHLFKSLGCAAENLVHGAAAQGHAADVTFDSTRDAVIVNLERSRQARATPLFEAIPRRQCTKTPYDGTLLSSDELRVLARAGEGSGARTLLLTERAHVDSIVEYVTHGNRAQLSDPAFRAELVSWIRFNHRDALRTGDGLAGRTGGQPSVPSWFGRRLLELLLTPDAQVKTDVSRIRSSAAIAVFVATRDDKAAWVEVGRIYERFALQAAAADIRTAFINQPVEVRALRPQLESSLGLENETAHLIVRVGRAPLAPFSLRRPIDEVFMASRGPAAVMPASP
jgi:hypothetical protein